MRPVFAVAAGAQFVCMREGRHVWRVKAPSHPIDMVEYLHLCGLVDLCRWTGANPAKVFGAYTPLRQLPPPPAPDKFGHRSILGGDNWMG